MQGVLEKGDGYVRGVGDSLGGQGAVGCTEKMDDVLKPGSEGSRWLLCGAQIGE